MTFTPRLHFYVGAFQVCVLVASEVFLISTISIGGFAPRSADHFCGFAKDAKLLLERKYDASLTLSVARL